MSHRLYIVGNAKTRQAYDCVFLPDTYVQGASEYEFAVPYDTDNKTHTKVKPGDIWDGRENFSPPVVTQEVITRVKEIVSKESHPSDIPELHARCDAAKVAEDLPVPILGNRNWYVSNEEIKKSIGHAIESLAKWSR